MFIGKELVYDGSLGMAERFYIALFGVPINGLRNRARRILPYITDRYKSVLDAGCGQGIMTFEIARHLKGGSITGFDIDETLLERNERIAGRIGADRCRFEFQDITRMDIEDRFDLILSVDNLEHIENDKDLLRRFHRALTDDGEVLIHVPGYFRRWKLFGWAVNFDVDGHVRPGYTRDQITEKVCDAGFEIIEAYYTYGWLETVTNNISYWITGARMKRKALYAAAFPILLFASYFGRKSRPSKGAGVLVRARKTRGGIAEGGRGEAKQGGDQ